MIVKILRPSAAKSQSFNGISYNLGKVEKDKGELLKTANFGALQGLDHLRPKDYFNYLAAWSARSARIKLPQFHAVISCKGRSHSKEQLTEVADRWLRGMGYGDQPYLLVFHKDTDNNHIHMVSTRINKEGRKIKDSFEQLQAYEVLNQVMGEDEKYKAETDLTKAFSYHFTTRAQFMMILEMQGYSLKLVGTGYQVSKFGKHLASVELAEVDARIKLYDKNIDRLAQLRAIFYDYRKIHDPAIIPVMAPLPGGRSAKPTAYTSEMAQLLAGKFGVEVLFHGTTDKPPYGYTLIDHAKKAAYKGNDLMPIAEFIKPSLQADAIQELANTRTKRANQGADRPDGETEMLEPKGFENEGDTVEYSKTLPETTSHTTWMPELNIDISDDIDDEAILGRNRQRKRKARTNTR